MQLLMLLMTLGSTTELDSILLISPSVDICKTGHSFNVISYAYIAIASLIV